MKISELKSGQGKVDVVVKVKSKDEPRSMIKFGKELSVCNAMVGDDSGEIKMTLWNDDIPKVSVGANIHVVNGYVSEFQGEKQLTAGKFGKIEVVEEESSEDELSEDEPKEKDSEKKVDVASDEMVM